MPKRRADEVEDDEEEISQGSDDGKSNESGSDDGSSSDSDSEPEVSDDEEDSAGEEDEEYKEINVDFEFFDPSEKDFLGLKALLLTYLDGRQFDCSGLVDTIIQQPSVGTVVKTGEADDPIGVMTMLNLQRYKDKAFLEQLKEFLLEKCEAKELQEKLKQAWQQPATAVLINERLINAPPVLAPPLTQALLDEMKWATEDEPTQELRNAFKIKHFLLATRVYSDPLPERAALPPLPAGPGKKKKQKAAAQQPLIVYVRPEDEYMHSRCAWSFTFPVENRTVAKDELQPLRLVMLVSEQALQQAKKQLDEVVGAQQQQAQAS